MVLTDGEHVEAESVGEGDLGDQIAQPDIRKAAARLSRAAAISPKEQRPNSMASGSAASWRRDYEG
jgi:hypothetical protein